MKKRFFLWNILSGAFVFGQITVDFNNLPTVGSQVITIQQSNLNGINVGNPGENQHYDFSFFTNGEEDIIMYLEPSETPYANSFSNSNLASLSFNTSDCIFFNSTTSHLDIIGMSLLISETIPMDIGIDKLFVVSSDPLTQINLPATYQSSFSDLSKFYSKAFYFHQVISQDPMLYIDSVRLNFSDDRSSLIDGWGTITTPYGTFDVLRQVVEDIRTISVEAYTLVELMPGSPFPLGYQSVPNTEGVDTIRTYYYLSNSTGIRPSILAEIQENNQGVIISANYNKDIFPLSINKSNSSQTIQVFPNPSSDFIHISSDFNLKHIKLFSSDGKELINKELNYKITYLDLKDYISGIYTLILETDKGLKITKINKL